MPRAAVCELGPQALVPCLRSTHAQLGGEHRRSQTAWWIRCPRLLLLHDLPGAFLLFCNSTASLQPELGDFLSYPILTLTSTPVPSVRRKKKKVSSELLLILVSSFG